MINAISFKSNPYRDYNDFYAQTRINRQSSKEEKIKDLEKEISVIRDDLNRIDKHIEDCENSITQAREIDNQAGEIYIMRILGELQFKKAALEDLEKAYFEKYNKLCG